MTVEIILLLVIGLLAGVFGGLLGVGGSVIMLPGLAIVFAHKHPVDYQHVYQAAAMVLNCAVTLPAAWTHYRERTIIARVIWAIIPTSLVGIILGVGVSNLHAFQGAGAIYLRRALGLFLLYVVAYNLLRLVRQDRLPPLTDEKVRALPWWKPAALVGLPMGFLGGLLGIGGGAVCVPFQQVLMKIPLRPAIANSAATIIFSAVLGAAYKLASLPQGATGLALAVKIVAVLLPTCFIGGWLGARLNYVLPRNAVRTAFIALMLYAGLRLLLGH